MPLRLRAAAEALAQPARRLGAQVLLGGEPRRDRVLRQAHLAELQGEAAAARDLHRVRQRFGNVGEQRGHLLGGAQVLLPRVAAHPAGVGEQRAIVNADARLVGIKLLGPQEAHVVGRHDGHAALGRQRHRAGDVRLFEGAAQALQLEVEAPGKERQPRLERAFGVVFAPVNQGAADITLGGAGERDQAGEILHVQPGAFDARCTALRPVQIRTAHEAGEVAVAARRLAQQREAGGRLAFALLAHQQIDPDQRLHARLEGLAVELHHGKEIVLVGHRHGRHAGGRGRGHQFRNAHHAVAEGVLSVQAQVDEAV